MSNLNVVETFKAKSASSKSLAANYREAAEYANTLDMAKRFLRYAETQQAVAETWQAAAILAKQSGHRNEDFSGFTI